MSLLWTKVADNDVRQVPVHEVMGYQPTDFPTWKEVHDNFHWDHPTMKNFVKHIGEHGVKKPIRVDYENDPPTVENGHTRALAAAKAGLSHIPVKQYEWPGDIDEDDREGYEG
jgi:hypothetical protein